MINFRYHVVSLVAVFLSLGVGVLVGSSFIAESTVKALETSQKNLGSRNEELRELVTQLEKTNETLRTYVDSSLTATITGQLSGKTVLLVSLETADRNVLAKLEEGLLQSGANLEGSVVLSSKLDLKSESRRQQVALALETTVVDEAGLRRQLIEALNAILTGNRQGGLQRFIDAEVAELRDVPPRVPLSALPSKGAGIVLVAPAPDGSTEFEGALLLPLVSVLGDAGVPCVVGESASDSLELVRLVRDANLKVSTVDGLESSAGIGAAIFSVRDAFGGKLGHYGFGPGTQTALPAATP